MSDRKMIKLGLLLAIAAPIVAGLSCGSSVSIGSGKYDWSSLTESTTTIQGSVIESPPTRNRADVHVSLCGPVKLKDGTATQDRCSDKALACEVVTNLKDGQSDRVISVKNYGIQGRNERQSEFGDASTATRGVWVVLDGETWAGTALSLNVSLICDSSSGTKSPVVTRADDDKGMLLIEWRGKMGCRSDDKGSGSPNREGGGGMSGAGTFFLILFLGLGAYFIGGSAYNYVYNGVRTLPEMLPNYEFWLRLIDIIRGLFRKSSYVSL